MAELLSAEIQNSLQSALQELDEANKRYEEAKLQESRARSVEVAASNALNEAQRKFDDIVASIKRNAPHGSEWKRRDGTVVKNG